MTAVLVLASCSTSRDRPPTPDRGDSGRSLRLLQPRAVHHATRLADGHVLVTGGCTLPGCEGFDEARASELFDPGTGRFEPGPEMRQPRASGTSTLLPDGRVLLTGGYPGEGMPAQADAEIYDPAVDRFLPTSPMTTPRADHSATMVDGKVLLAGGVDADGRALSSTEWFDPTDGSFSAGPRLDQPRAAHVAVLAGREVVLIGGTRGTAALDTTSTLEAGQWLPGPRLKTPRVKLGAVSLAHHAVLVVGGSSTTEGTSLLATTELLDLRRGQVSSGPRLSEGEYKLEDAVVRLDDGRVVIAGGEQVDVYDPRTDEISVLGSPSMGRRSFVTATAIGADRVLVAGGYDEAIEPTDQAWTVTIT